MVLFFTNTKCLIVLCLVSLSKYHKLAPKELICEEFNVIFNVPDISIA